MQGQTQAAEIGFDELGALKLLALAGAVRGETKISCATLADRLDASTQTASRRLRALERTGHVTRDQAGDGQWVTITEAGERALEAEYEAYRRIFESDPDTVLTGSITSGMGEGRHYISLAGYMEQFTAKLGYEPFPGTLNVTLAPESQRRRSALAGRDGVRITEWADEDRTYGAATCYPATVSASAGSYEEAHVIVPDRTHHDEDQIEVIAPERLRDVLSLEDGAEVEVRVVDE
jgi:riboflavin kinase